jgi:hypothetical protein
MALQFRVPSLQGFARVAIDDARIDHAASPVARTLLRRPM